MFNNKRIKQLEGKVEELDSKVNNLERINWNNRYPNGKLYICHDMEVVEKDSYYGGGTYTHPIYKLMFKFSYDSNSDMIVSFFDTPYIGFKSEHIGCNKYFISSTDGKYHYLINTSTNQSIQVDKDMKVIL